MAVQRYFGYLYRFAENPSKLEILNLWLTATSPDLDEYYVQQIDILLGILAQAVMV
jgi:hypothetical protein